MKVGGPALHKAFLGKVAYTSMHGMQIAHCSKDVKAIYKGNQTRFNADVETCLIQAVLMVHG